MGPDRRGRGILLDAAAVPPDKRRMSPAALFPLLLVFFAGGFIALQAPTNAILGKAGGSPILAALISFAVGTLALAAAWLATRQRLDTVAFRQVPAYAWLGGLYGAIFVSVAAYAAPRIGIAALITIGIAGQITMALLLDHFGALGLARAPINFGRVIGAVLVLAGVVLVRRS
jgi:transporter family-2 protein